MGAKQCLPRCGLFCGAKLHKFSDIYLGMYATFYYSPNYHGVIVGQYVGEQRLVVALLVEVGMFFFGKIEKNIKLL